MNEFSAARRAAVSSASIRRHKTFFLRRMLTLHRVEAGKASSGLSARCTAPASRALLKANSMLALACSAFTEQPPEILYLEHRPYRLGAWPELEPELKLIVGSY